MDINIFKFNDNERGGYYFNDAVLPEEADLVLVSAPWSATSDFGQGASYAPDALLDASTHIGLYDVMTDMSLVGKVATAEIDYSIQELSQHLGGDVEKVLSHVEDGGSISGEYFARKVTRVNQGLQQMHANVAKQVGEWLDQGRTVGVVGGDHSVSFGAVKAVSERYDGVGVLFLDAHCDLRGEKRIFKYSFDSVARNIVDELPGVSRVVEVGVRDVCEEELSYAANHEQICLFLQERLMAERFRGKTWAAQCSEIVAKLPQKVYVSLDIDVLTIESCPNTKRPVPGGISFNEVASLLCAVVDSGREIVGFDLTEIVPKMEATPDATVGARMLFKMCGAALKSRMKR